MTATKLPTETEVALAEFGLYFISIILFLSALVFTIPPLILGLQHESLRLLRPRFNILTLFRFTGWLGSTTYTAVDIMIPNLPCLTSTIIYRLVNISPAITIGLQLMRHYYCYRYTHYKAAKIWRQWSGSDLSASDDVLVPDAILGKSRRRKTTVLGWLKHQLRWVNRLRLVGSYPFYFALLVLCHTPAFLATVYSLAKSVSPCKNVGTIYAGTIEAVLGLIILVVYCFLQFKIHLFFFNQKGVTDAYYLKPENIALAIGTYPLGIIGNFTANYTGSYVSSLLVLLSLVNGAISGFAFPSAMILRDIVNWYLGDTDSASETSGSSRSYSAPAKYRFTANSITGTPDETRKSLPGSGLNRELDELKKLSDFEEIFSDYLSHVQRLDIYYRYRLHLEITNYKKPENADARAGLGIMIYGKYLKDNATRYVYLPSEIDTKQLLDDYNKAFSTDNASAISAIYTQDYFDKINEIIEKDLLHFLNLFRKSEYGTLLLTRNMMLTPEIALNA